MNNDTKTVHVLIEHEEYKRLLVVEQELKSKKGTDVYLALGFDYIKREHKKVKIGYILENIFHYNYGMIRSTEKDFNHLIFDIKMKLMGNGLLTKKDVEDYITKIESVAVPGEIEHLKMENEVLRNKYDRLVEQLTKPWYKFW